MKTRSEMKVVDDGVKLYAHQIKQAQGIGNEISKVATRIDALRGMVEEELLDEELYKGFVERQKKIVKELVAQLYVNIELSKVKSGFDEAFEEPHTLTKSQKRKIEREYKGFSEMAEYGLLSGMEYILNIIGEEEFADYLHSIF